jgi:hypothetical protein
VGSQAAKAMNILSVIIVLLFVGAAQGFLLSLIAMLFVYYFLARLEEKECEEKFGPSYLEYKKRTGMFFPLQIHKDFRLPLHPDSRAKKIIAVVGLYFVASAIALTAAHLLKVWSIEKLYAFYEGGAAWVSVTPMSDDALKKVAQAVLSDPSVRDELSRHDLEKEKFVGFVLPVGYYALEIPMPPEKVEQFHFIKRQYNGDVLKVVMTGVDGSNRGAKGESILLNAVHKFPVA